MILKDIPKLVINLPARTDRLIHIKNELKDWDFQIVNGVRAEKVIQGIGQAHVNCVLLAKQNDWDQVLIMEDDVELRKGCEEYLNLAFKCTPNDWELLLGGIYHGKVFKYNDYWNKTGEFCGLHFYIVRKSAYDKVLEYDGKHHIDRWMNRYGTRLNTYVTSKFVAIQQEGYSDNVNKNVNYADKLSRYKLL